MDFFGIGQAVQAALFIYFQASRATGRTTSLLESVKDGDRIVFANFKEADKFNRLCLERGVKVECIVVLVADISRLFERGPSQGRTIFDHGWVQEYYLKVVEGCGKDIREFETLSSGCKDPYRETRRKAMELSKFNRY